MARQKRTKTSKTAAKRKKAASPRKTRSGAASAKSVKTSAAKKSAAKASGKRKFAAKTRVSRKAGAHTRRATARRATATARSAKTAKSGSARKIGSAKTRKSAPKASPKTRSQSSARATPQATAPGSRVPAAARARPRTDGRRGRSVGEAVRTAQRTDPRTSGGIKITGAMRPRFGEILSPAALAFLAELHRKFEGKRRELLAKRAEQQERYDSGALPDFLIDTADIRNRDWRVAPIPEDLLDRRVEITGPVDRKMMINALNSGANVYMADFEDANSPTWENNLDGQINFKDRWAGKLAFSDSQSGKDYSVGNNPAVMIVRPRGWHLLEEHLSVDGEVICGSLFDFGLTFFHNAKAQVAHGTGPYFYLPKLETHEEARLWNDVFVFAQSKLGLPKGTIKATVLIETLPAAFEMDEILYELRDHITGLNAGRWDYIFSFIKKLANNNQYVLPDRSQVVMGKAFLKAYADLLIKTCHRRGAFAMGGMAAQIPIKNDPAANEAAFAKVRADKEREARDGHDGTWVAHPDLVPVAKQVFDRLMPQKNQLDRTRDDVRVTRDDMLRLHEGTKTEAGFRENIRVGMQYIEAWLRGRGAVPIYNLMEDAATAEISRAQIWQWLKYGAELEGGIKVTPDFFERALKEEMERVKSEIGAENYARGRFPEAIKLFHDLSLGDDFADFLTVPAYKLIA